MKKLVCLLALLLFSFSFTPQPQALDYDAYDNPLRYPEGRARDNAYQRQGQAQYWNEYNRREMEQNRYWDSIRRERENRTYDYFYQQEERRRSAEAQRPYGGYWRQQGY